jgi:tetraacyldisaccharide 4'-kinase
MAFMPHSTADSSTKFSAWLQSQWTCFTPWQIFLLPLAALFYLISLARRLSYGLGARRGYRMPVPVIVVGNLTVGGTGKTPLVLWLVEFLRSHGYRPGIISRGYASRASSPQSVSATSDPALVGDEPVLLAKRVQCPVWVGERRADVARALLTARPDCDVLISDDGLQHYALQRDVEVVVIDGNRRFGNGLLLPAGPLREPLSRLKSVDAVVVNGGSIAPGEYAMQLAGDRFHQIRQPLVVAVAAEFVGKRLHAMAGIGDPSRFFAHLRKLGLQVVEHPFPDHYTYQPHELQFKDADAILMTEKDAVKCAAFAPPNAWALAVDAEMDAAFGNKILEKLRKHHGRQAA